MTIRGRLIIVPAIAATAVLVSCVSRSDDTSAESKRAAAALDWIRGAGKAAVVVHDATRSLLSDEITPARCETAVADLDQTTEPAEVVEMITKVPDATLRDALSEEQGLFQAVVSDCLQQLPPTSGMGAAELRAALELVTVRLRQLEDAAR